MAWDERRLAGLRAKYCDQGDRVFLDPRFRKVADRIYKNGRSAAPYRGVQTFLSAPYRQIDPDNPDFGDLQVAISGVPRDLGVTNRSGARLGPRALRAIDCINTYNHVLHCAAIHEVRAADIGDVSFASRYGHEESHGDIERHVARIVDAGVLALSVGGDHSITYPILKAVGKKARVCLIHIDAHCDTSGPLDNARFHHGGPVRNAVLEGVLDPTRTIQIGIRSSEYLWEFSYDSGMTVVYVDEIDTLGIPAVIARGARACGGRPDLHFLRHRQPRSELCAWHWHALDRRADDPGGAGDPAGSERPQRRRRRCRGRSPIRLHHQHGARRRSGAVRDPQRHDVQPGSAKRVSGGPVLMWSSGQAEGQITRVTLPGRAGLDLLRRRVLLAAYRKVRKSQREGRSDRPSFIAMDLHHLLLAGLPAHLVLTRAWFAVALYSDVSPWPFRNWKPFQSAKE